MNIPLPVLICVGAITLTGWGLFFFSASSTASSGPDHIAAERKPTQLESTSRRQLRDSSPPATMVSSTPSIAPAVPSQIPVTNSPQTASYPASIPSAPTDLSQNSSALRSNSSSRTPTTSVGATPSSTSSSQPPVQIGFSSNGGGNGTPSTQSLRDAQTIEVDPSLTIPAALAPVEQATTLTPTQQQQSAEAGDDFLAEVDEAVAKGATPSQAWKSRQAASDDAYRAQFGADAYLTQSASASLSAKPASQ